MNIDRLVMMANQIAAFHRHKPQDQAAAAIAEHLRKYWEPRMRSALAAHLAQGGSGLDPLALAAAGLLAAAQPGPAPGGAGERTAPRAAGG